MGFWDEIGDDVKEQGTVLAFDWLKQQIGVQQQPAPVSAPAQVAAQTAPQPGAVTQAQADQSKMLTYVSIGIALLGLLLVIFPTKGK